MLPVPQCETRATMIEVYLVHHFFPEISSIWELKTSPKTCFGQKIELLPADEKPHLAKVYNEKRKGGREGGREGGRGSARGLSYALTPTNLSNLFITAPTVLELHTASNYRVGLDWQWW